MHDAALRTRLVGVVRRLDALGLNRGSTGNVSARGGADPPGLWITPSGMGADEIAEDDLVWLPLDGGEGQGRWQPSSEAPFHRAIYRERRDLHAVVHVHSPQATALCSLRRGLPAFHYMVAIAGGDDVPCTPYHLFGSEALSQAVAHALRERNACLMANHGLVAAGADLDDALKIAVEIEALCGSYLAALAVGEPVLLSREEMAEVVARFACYGRSRSDAS